VFYSFYLLEAIY
jgi:hypothetical protein